MVNFLKYFYTVLPLIAPATSAIEALVTEAKSGATKKQLAVDSLGVATAIAGTIDPANSSEIHAANTLVSTAIDSIVALQNAFKPKAAAAAAVAGQ